ncbi:hypothetical protein [Sphingobacterium lactis]|uniref:Uncharacterized protein n=1 Tax=Sphingobacterium lactis TaxID=797291 RepID=A0A1H5UEU3_9SPHI|nr:hypothetical protein [Sphingobacterium lactis]SEF73526.1 hypothetical protein SAMN05421877_102271 [Sphingobacterium lactis]
MNKAQIAKQLAKQTLEQEHDLRASFLKETSAIKKGIVTVGQTQNVIIQNQQVIHEAIKALVEVGTNLNQAEILQELSETKKEYQKMKRLIVICFLSVLVPLLAVLAALLVVHLLTT